MDIPEQSEISATVKSEVSAKVAQKEDVSHGNQHHDEFLASATVKMLAR